MDALPPGGDPFDALGDPNRRAIVELLVGGGRSVREIADDLPGATLPRGSAPRQPMTERTISRGDRTDPTQAESASR